MLERGVYRSAYEALADDADFQELSSLAQAVFWTLRLKLGQYGIAVFYTSVLAEYHRKDSPAAIEAAVRELEAPKPGRDHGWIRRDRNVVWLINGLRHEPSITLANAKHRTGARRYAASLPACETVKAFVAYYDLDGTHTDPSGMPSPSHSDGYRMATPYTETEREREPETEPERETEPEKTAAATAADVPGFARDVADALPTDDDRANLATFLSRCADPTSARSWAANFRASLNAMPGHTAATGPQLAQAIGDHVRNGAATNSKLFRKYLLDVLAGGAGSAHAASSASAPGADRITRTMAAAMAGAKAAGLKSATEAH